MYITSVHRRTHSRVHWSMFASRPLVVFERSRGNTVKERISTSPLAHCESRGSFKQAHRGAKSAGSSSKGAGLVGTRVQGKEPEPTRHAARRGNGGFGTGKRVVASRPGKTYSPSSTGKGSAHSPSLAREGGAQIKWDVGFVRGTRIAKIDRVVRGTKGKRRRVLLTPKELAARGNARRCRFISLNW